ncbi:Uncharacterised protein [Candidatus Venteria ishoeyi]|uniref:Uncharacterized protein n=1 Tax=Candidatus Venteria ishoeyi TaxID=1899563 RepID=A0A1H6FES2_9GAMM|nr:Uncharacterised protein [Candidatus Venteria ishoeyi]
MLSTKMGSANVQVKPRLSFLLRHCFIRLFTCCAAFVFGGKRCNNALPCCRQCLRSVLDCSKYCAKSIVSWRCASHTNALSKPKLASGLTWIGRSSTASSLRCLEQPPKALTGNALKSPSFTEFCKTSNKPLCGGAGKAWRKSSNF